MDTTDKPIKRILTRWNDAIGKTLTSVDVEGCSNFDNFLVLRFGDEAILLSYGGVDNDRLSDEPDDISSKYSDDRRARVYFGIDSLAEYEAEEALAYAQRRIDAEKRERADYERLKKRFA